VVQQRLPKLSQVSIPPQLMRNLRRMLEVRRMHQLQILLVLCRRPACNLIHPLARMPLIQPSKAIKSSKKLIVSAQSCGSRKAAH
jgi:hypothetical protein